MLCGDGLCVGRDSSDPVSKEYPSGFEFEGDARSEASSLVGIATSYPFLNRRKAR